MISILKPSVLYAQLVRIHYYCSAVLEYLFSPHGLVSSPAKRLSLQCDLVRDPSKTQDSSSGRRICIFIAYQRRLNRSTRLYLEFLHSLGFAIFFVNNLPTSSHDIQFLSTFAARIYNRVNQGQDVGAMKDLFLMLHREGLLSASDYLMIANDSMQFIPGRFAESMGKLIEKELASGRSAVFSHVNFQHHKHYQSFFQILSREIFGNREFVRFWQSYVPLSHRGHAIDNGEVKLTRKIYSRYINIAVLYSTQQYARIANGLARSICARPTAAHEDSIESAYHDQLLSLPPFRFLPTPAASVIRYRNWYYADFFALDSPIRAFTETKLDRTNSPTKSDSQDSHDLDAEKAATFYASSELVELLESSNQTHTGAFLYPLLLGCPLVKKDICFMGTFPIGIAVGNYQDLLNLSLPCDSEESRALKAELQEEFALLLTSRGTPASYRRNRSRAIRMGLLDGFLYPYDPTSTH